MNTKEDPPPPYTQFQYGPPQGQGNIPMQPASAGYPSQNIGEYHIKKILKF